ncbi:MAG: hypothetical protein E7447_00605 [Ruminococcaceae bacterium]|nr:hypothetical protein [Oscillospiraceae bacterium]
MKSFWKPGYLEKLKKPAFLPFAVLILGIVTAVFRLYFFNLGTDDRGLYPAGHLFDSMSWVYVAIAMVLLFIGTRKLGGLKKYEENFPASTVPALGTVLAAAAFCIAVIAELAQPADIIQTTAAVLGFVAVAALLVLAWCRYIGLKPNMLLHTAVCVFLLIYLVSHYRLWSSYPQLQTYAFELLAIVFTMLAGYQRAAFDVDLGNRRDYAFFSLSALFFSIATLPSCDNPVFFIGCAVWMFFTLCSLEPGEDEVAEEENTEAEEENTEAESAE